MSGSLLRPQMLTAAPSFASRCAMALPMPRPPPVMSATPPASGFSALAPLFAVLMLVI
jgi:hypothetical protein